METHEYINGEITVIWEPKKCIHAAICVKSLPQVYRPNEKPWLKPENATPMELKNQIDLCPSGALSYKFNTKK
ncbi:(4Fe-4S)-binding protein [Chryseobacterium chendengshani]|uniref:(4Fe-4S)-binding protein n=1 Tax=unclassified Chryseobacterium TaxID=2593645 RepID=UPI001C63F0BB|nr:MULTISPECIES: (4Fe-4S)-binding protein [unclassified Chryseobacterium]MBW7676261.1 (4Fe-4S)-binding protein [Chryseobacterium sp. LJ756]MBW8524130.1 (4Fe-4S)-binding protein [Chryseobacterium sp. LJ668]QYK17064.1 (4Fe-4S)-binding protein [Chryseobacterium sp. LJ668]